MDRESALELLGNKQFFKLKSELQEMNPADIAVLLEEMYEYDEFDEKKLIMLYRILPLSLRRKTKCQEWQILYCLESSLRRQA